MTISKKDQERLIDSISASIGKTVAALALLDVLKITMGGGSVNAEEVVGMVTDHIRRTLSRYQITEKPN